MTRTELLFILDAALANGQPQYAREAALAWLGEWPGDIGIQFLLGKACRAEGQAQRAAAAFEAVVSADPEHAEAQALLAEQLLRLNRPAEAALAYACHCVLDGVEGHAPPADLSVPAWLPAVREGKAMLDRQDWEQARARFESALLGDPPTPLPFLLHLQSFWKPQLFRSALPLAEVYRKRWPRCVAIQLGLAECLLQSGDSARAVEILHTAASLDNGGEVPARYWGQGNPYRGLWPSHPGSALPGPLPSSVAAALGLNRLPHPLSPPRTRAADKFEPKTEAAEQDQPREHTSAARAVEDAGSVKRKEAAPGGVPPAGSGKRDPRPRTAAASAPAESLIAIQAELDRVAAEIARRKRSPDLDDRRPAYVIVTSQSRLIGKYGSDWSAEIEAEMDRAIERIRKTHGWPAYAVYVDDAESLAEFELQPVNPGSAWDIKKLIADIDQALADGKEMIGALLILGGDEIVPLHRLPNPTDDVDGDVPSDNPYATRDENYFIVEWPVGRLPGGEENDPALLLKQLRGVGLAAKGQGAKGGLPDWMVRLFTWWRRSEAGAGRSSFGYAASIWKPASLEVFSPIGEPRKLMTSPPVGAGRLPPQAQAPAQFSYYNLHGLEDSPEWYGQRPPEDPSDGLPEYPVAIRPSDVLNSGRAPEVVFSEACYGGNIQHKAIDEAMCLKFLASGSRAVIGSTKIAYGSITAPLIGADLLTKLTWGFVLRGVPLGEALRRAKLSLAQEMHRRQGYLDGEDQKTLISFVLYGDPLYTAPGVKSKTKWGKTRSSRRKTRPAPLPTLDSGSGDEGWRDGADSETLAQIKSIVSQYLPGMAAAEMRVWQASHAAQAKLNSPSQASRRKVVSLAKTQRVQSRVHHQIARLTLDENGKVLKLAVSR